MEAIINGINSKTHNTFTGPAPNANILGMNFQAVSVGQKLVYQDGAVPAGFSVTGGYLDGMGTPSPIASRRKSRSSTTSIGLMVTELSKKHMLDSTLIIITAKHGQSPIDPNSRAAHPVATYRYGQVADGDSWPRVHPGSRR